MNSSDRTTGRVVIYMYKDNKLVGQATSEVSVDSLQSTVENGVVSDALGIASMDARRKLLAYDKAIRSNK